MIHHWKGLHLEITDFEYQYDPMTSVEIIPTQTSRFVICGYYFVKRDGGEHPTSFVEESQKNEAG